MSVDVDSQDTDLIGDNVEIDDDEATPKLTGKEANQHTLEMRRKIEDRSSGVAITLMVSSDGGRFCVSVLFSDACAQMGISAMLTSEVNASESGVRCNKLYFLCEDVVCIYMIDPCSYPHHRQ